MSKWRTKISATKTVYTIFNKGGFFINDKIHLIYNNQELKAEKNFKFLGITLDPKLSFSKHISELVTRANKRLNILKSIKGRTWGASSKLIITSYMFPIRPIIEYAPFITTIVHQTNLEKLERVQRAAVRIAPY